MLHKRLIYLAITAAIAIILASSAMAATAVGDKAPNFKLDSLSGSNTVKLSDFSGKPTVVVFWASWCPHCQRELPVLQKVYKDLKPGANFVGLSVDQDIKDARSLVKDKGITFPNAYCGTSSGEKVMNTYGISGIPAIYVLDKNGTVKARHLGETKESTIRSDLADLGVK
ncbi:MAG: TlpA disulfide reductase family protein [Armatimonadota bacterium]|nr:TlpA family protein disulfide reductase [bacterium]